MFALVDCNNFFASCERLFRPELKNRPVVVLSNNDGCVVARSQEAKNIGIPMAAPAYKYRELFRRYDVAVFSGNFSLYGDISNRVMSILAQEVHDLEIYSIDEAFLYLSSQHIKDDLEFCKRVRSRILKEVGLPVSIGIAETKILAKLANHLAKKEFFDTSGVFDWNNLKDREQLLKKLPVEEIWGIGYRLRIQLNAEGVYTIWDFLQKDETWLRQNFSVNGSRILYELKGIPCIEIQNKVLLKKNITSSRSFGKPVNSLKAMCEAVATYAFRATEKLRIQNQVAQYVTVGIKTNKHRPDFPQYYNFHTITLDSPSDDPSHIIKKALEAVRAIYKRGYFYKKASVTLGGVVPKSNAQIGLLENIQVSQRMENLQKAVDKINYENGSESIRYGAMGFNREWKVRMQYASQKYTTKWNDLLVIRD